MNIYRIKGLSCADCTQRMEEQIQRLEYGRDARLSYASGKLYIDPNVKVEAVERILRSEGAALVRRNFAQDTHSGGREGVQAAPAHLDSDHAEAHGHDHDHTHGTMTVRMGGQLVLATAAYVLSFVLDGRIPGLIVIGLYLFAIAVSGYSTFARGLRNLLRFKFNIDTLMTIALIGAVGIGEWKEATLVAILFGLNELLEGLGMEKARRSMESLFNLAPVEALLIENGDVRNVPIDSLEAGDIVQVRPGAQIPSDGTIIEGRSSVNEAAITGESLPVDKEPGLSVFGGSLNNEGLLIVRLDKPYRDSSISKMIHLIQEAQETKTPTELFINKFAKLYTPAIIVIALLVMAVPPLAFGGAWRGWFYQGLAVLIVGCPCALILSSPIAILAGITRNARNGVLVKGGVFLEQLGQMEQVAFDKTGTLTRGHPAVETAISYDDRFLRVAAALEQGSSHPLAEAIVRYAREHGIEPPAVTDAVALPGQGVTGVVDGTAYWAGNEHSPVVSGLTEAVKQDVTRCKEAGLTLVLITDGTNVLGLFGLADEIREESREVIAALHRQGIAQTVMLTGDHAASAEKTAQATGVSEYYGGLLPEDKVRHIRELAARGKVAMVGDGINDAPAMAAASIGIAMGKGTDTAIETADIVLMQDHLGKLPEAVRTAKKVNRIIRANITIALGLKALALLLTIPGMLTLWLAILSDMGATILVTLISLTILAQRRSSRIQGGKSR